MTVRDSTAMALLKSALCDHGLEQLAQHAGRAGHPYLDAALLAIRLNASVAPFAARAQFARVLASRNLHGDALAIRRGRSQREDLAVIAAIRAAALHGIVDGVEPVAPKATFPLCDASDGAVRNGAVKVDIGTKTGIAAIEARMTELESDRAGAPLGPASVDTRVTFDNTQVFFKEQWSAMLAEKVAERHPGELIAWGRTIEPDLSDGDSYAYALSVLQSLQRGRAVRLDGAKASRLDPDVVRKQVWQRHMGLLGEGGRLRRLVEFDDEAPVAPVLMEGGPRRGMFRETVRMALRGMEVGSLVRGAAGGAHGAKGALLDFLYELHGNGRRYAASHRGVRMLRLQKHLADSREKAMAKADSFAELAEYVGRQPQGAVNLIEASVSDFGPGILQSFRQSPAGKAHEDRPDDELLSALLHDQLSSSSDPGAGLGIPNALAAARTMGAFVSLRTGRHWAVLDGCADNTGMMSLKSGPNALVQGTHWQLVYPDPLR